MGSNDCHRMTISVDSQKLAISGDRANYGGARPSPGLIETEPTCSSSWPLDLQQHSQLQSAQRDNSGQRSPHHKSDVTVGDDPLPLASDSFQITISRQAQIEQQNCQKSPVFPYVLMQKEEEQPDPDRYGNDIIATGVVAKKWVAIIFQGSKQRARERQNRVKAVDDILASPIVSAEEKCVALQRLFVQEQSFLRILRTPETSQNFAAIKVIGKGAFGVVRLVQRKTDGKIYALKSMAKSSTLRDQQQAHVRAERDILARSENNPWLVRLYSSFQDSSSLYLLMEFLPGGDLMSMLIKHEFFSEDITRFYIAELIMAVEAIQRLGFLHRDIKPDNILLDRGGHIKLADFGLSTSSRKEHGHSYYQNLLQFNLDDRTGVGDSSELPQQVHLTEGDRGIIDSWRKSRRHVAYSVVGTPDYMAPEVLLGQGYTDKCDWWSVGAIMYECLVGWAPFCAENKHDTARKIVLWESTLTFPVDFPLSSDAVNLIRSLLCWPHSRLGSSEGSEEGGLSIKQHDFFRGVLWDRLRTYRAPFEPALSSEVDVSYFPIDEISQDDDAMNGNEHAHGLPVGGTSDQTLAFLGYTYRAFPYR